MEVYLIATTSIVNKEPAAKAKTKTKTKPQARNPKQVEKPKSE
jgi:hypothetical protein